MNDCGHEDQNPIRFSHLDVEGLEYTVCHRCFTKPETREELELMFGPEMEERRQTWKGMSAKERKKVQGQTLRKMKEGNA